MDTQIYKWVFGESVLVLLLCPEVEGDTTACLVLCNFCRIYHFSYFPRKRERLPRSASQWLPVAVTTWRPGCSASSLVTRGTGDQGRRRGGPVPHGGEAHTAIREWSLGTRGSGEAQGRHSRLQP